ncbi:MAG: BTAD domain-containing putative transcriptional regulator [Microvirga sp.]
MRKTPQGADLGDVTAPSALERKVVSLEFGIRQPTARIHLLGAIRASSYLGKDLVPRGRKARAVLGYLAAHAGQRVPRARLAALLWDRVPDAQARTSLRQALRELTQAMGTLAAELIVAEVDTVKLDARVCWIDALAIVSPEPHSTSGVRGDLASLCRGELLEDLSGVTTAFDQWLLTERTRFTSQLTRLLEAELNQLCQSKASAERRSALARRVIEFEPTHEGASRILMRAMADVGERAQALREYERCRAALRSVLDVEPSSETRSLYQALKTFSGSSQIAGPPVAWHADSSGALPGVVHAAESTPVDQRAGRLSVGVLPFQAHSARDEGLAFSLSREIASGLARFRWFDVIAPSPASRRISKGARATPRWDYAVEGSLTSSETTLQISVCLLDLGQEARPVWSDRFELDIGALHEVGDRVVAPVVARIDPVILFIEGQPRRSRRSGATGLVLQAMPLMFSLDREKYAEAGRLLGEAVEIDPENAKALSWSAFWHVWDTGQGWAEDIERSLATAQGLALRAIRLDPENAEALGLYAHICAFLEHDFDTALHYFDRALRLNPNLAFIWAMSAPTYCYVGQPDRAIEHMDRYRELAPFDPHFQFWEGVYTIAYTFKGEYETAARFGRRAVKANPTFSNDYKPLIAALGHLGRTEDAAPYVERLLQLEPNFTVAYFGRTYPFQRDEDRRSYMHGLRLAGVPEA